VKEVISMIDEDYEDDEITAFERFIFAAPRVIVVVGGLFLLWFKNKLEGNCLS